MKHQSRNYDVQKPNRTKFPFQIEIMLLQASTL